jgi:hypothetical protein
MYVIKISLKVTCLAISAIGLLATVSTTNLMKNTIPTTYAQPMATATNNTQGMLTKFPFKPGMMVMPMTCSTPSDILKSRHLAGNSSAAEQMIKNRDDDVWFSQQEYDGKSIDTSTKYGYMFPFQLSPAKTLF